MFMSVKQIKAVAILAGVGALGALVYQESQIDALSLQNRSLEGKNHTLGMRLFEVCHWDLRDARVLNPSIPRLKTEYDATSNECFAKLPDGREVVWPPGAMPINRKLQLTPAQ